MALATRSYTIDELGDPTAPIGSRPWSLWVANEIRKALDTDDHIDQMLRDLTTAFKEQQAWQELGCLSWDDFCVKYLHRQPLRVDAALDLKAHGRPHKTEKPDNSNVFEYGNSADYLTARIKRDDPAVYARLQAGEFRSVRAQCAIRRVIAHGPSAAPTQPVHTPSKRAGPPRSAPQAARTGIR